MKHKSPAKLLRSVKRITKFIERKRAVPPPPCSDTIPSAPLDITLPQITLAQFESLLKSENKKRGEERRLERATREEQRREERTEDLRKLQVLLGLPP